MVVIINAWTLLYTYGRYCTRMDAIVHIQTLLYMYGRYCTHTDAFCTRTEVVL